jgi:hypothetical protein
MQPGTACGTLPGTSHSHPEPNRPEANMRVSDVNFRREAWWMLLLAALVPLIALMTTWLWIR